MICLGAISIEDFFDYKFNYKKHKVPLTYWEFLSTWLDDSKLIENCLFVFYEDMCSNFDATLERIIQFMGTALTPNERERVKYLSSFQYMKQNETKFDLHGLRQKIRDLADLEDYEMEETETPAFLNQGMLINNLFHLSTNQRISRWFIPTSQSHCFTVTRFER